MSNKLKFKNHASFLRTVVKSVSLGIRRHFLTKFFYSNNIVMQINNGR